MNRIAKMEEKERNNLVVYYQELLERLDLDDYKTSKEITRLINMNGREWRKHVENIMHLYMYDYLDKMVVGTQKGYLLTNDKDLINKFLKVKEHQFKSLAYNCYNLKKAVLHKDNYTLEEFLTESVK